MLNAQAKYATGTVRNGKRKGASELEDVVHARECVQCYAIAHILESSTPLMSTRCENLTPNDQRPTGRQRTACTYIHT